MTDQEPEAERCPEPGAMRGLLIHERRDLIARCLARAALRPSPRATAEQLDQGLPVFIDQLERALEADEARDLGASVAISGSAQGDAGSSQIGMQAAANGAKLMRLGFDVDAVVHCYGDLCQAMVDLASERSASFTLDDYRTLNRCLDNAIANAVAEFGAERDAWVARRRSADERRRLGALAHEMRNALQTSRLAYGALQVGALPASSATGAVLGRGLDAMGALLDKALGEAREPRRERGAEPAFALSGLIAEAAQAAALRAASRGCDLHVRDVDPAMGIAGDREELLAAVCNILDNAVKFTQPATAVTLSTRAEGDRIVIEVCDHCGGLPPGALSKMFRPFSQAGADRSGLGLGLTIARASVEAEGGEISARDLPGIGCCFCIALPRRDLS